MAAEWINAPDDVTDYVGFVYLIRCLVNGRYYIGKKLFTMSGRKVINGKKKKVRLSSKWQNYWGSCRELHEDLCKYGPEGFDRTILHLCKSKWELSFTELKEQLDRGVMTDPLSFNGIICVRLRKLNQYRFENSCCATK